MKKLISSIICVIALGCQLPQNNSYTEGTQLSLGLYIPISGSLYGLQCVNYLSGKRISVNTNEQLIVNSNHSITNSTFGIFNVNENSSVTIGDMK